MARKKQNLRLSNVDVRVITETIAHKTAAEVLEIAKSYGWNAPDDSKLTDEQNAMSWANSIRNKWRDNLATAVLVNKHGINPDILNHEFKNRPADILVEREGKNKGTLRKATKSEFLKTFLDAHYDGGNDAFVEKFDEKFPGPIAGQRGKKTDFAKSADAAAEFAMGF